MVEVELALAALADKVALANMLQLYTHDFSEQWAGQERGELGRDGRYEAYSYLDSYWQEKGRTPFLVKVSGHLSGFALVNEISHSGLPVDHNMAEFFIVRKHRRGGVGTIVAREIFSRHPGLWEAAVARRNVGALAFWRNAISGHPHAFDISETDIRSADWDGPILRFRIRS